jgi:acetyl-CoA C-acetyltransferase
MKRAYVVDAARTAVGKFGGTLASQRPDDLAAEVIKSLIDRNPSIDPFRYRRCFARCSKSSR